MKIASKEEVSEYTHAIMTGFLKGAALGTVASVGVWQILKRKSTIYNTWTPTTKTFFALTLPIAFGTTNTEWVSLKFDMNQYKFGDASDVAKKEQLKIENLTTNEKIKHYAIENKYKIIFAGWAASMGGSFWYINRDPLLSKAQKIVQARMYAQALTVVILLGSMLLSVNSYTSKSDEEEKQYSWEAIAAKEEEREIAAGLPIRLTKEKSEQ